MSKKDCDYFQEQISALLDGELNQGAQDRLVAHLTECDKCSTLCVTMAAVHGASKAGLLVDPPPSLHGYIMERVTAEAGATRRRKLWKLVAPALAAAACAGVILGMVLTLRPGAARGGSSGSAMAASSSEIAPQSAEAAAAADAGGGAVADTPAALFRGDGASESSAAESMTTTGAAPAEWEEGAVAGNAEAYAVLGTPAEPPQPTPAPEAAEDAATEADAEEPEETEAEKDAAGRALRLEVEIDSVTAAGFAGVVVSDPDGLLEEGEHVTVQPEAGTDLSGYAAGDRVLVRFDGLTELPGVWLISDAVLEDR